MFIIQLHWYVIFSDQPLIADTNAVNAFKWCIMIKRTSFSCLVINIEDIIKFRIAEVTKNEQTCILPPSAYQEISNGGILNNVMIILEKITVPSFVFVFLLFSLLPFIRFLYVLYRTVEYLSGQIVVQLGYTNKISACQGNIKESW